MKTGVLRTMLVAFPALCGFALSPGARADNATDAKDRGGDMFRMMDTNGDGKISADEHATAAKAMFDRMDANKDGKVTAAEMDAAHERMGKMAGGKGHRAGQMEMSAADKIKVMDANHDGVLSADEHAEGAKAMFDKMDTDKDGYLSRSELEAGHQRMMSKTADRPSEK